jgi:catechol 2,3-dioxygenase-like lactoylglutathione lyase family enzyme
MSTSAVRSNDATVARVDMKFEVVVIPVSDVDRAKEFYERLGWRLDADYDKGDDFRVIQFTPRGSGCSVIFGKNVTAAAPGSAQGLYLIVSDIEAAHDELVAHGVDASEVFHDAAGVYAGTDQPYLFGRRRASGPDPEHRSYRSFVSFSDPDGNGWLLQEIRDRLPGRGVTLNVTALGQLLHEAAEHHGSFEAVAPKHDWWDWYATYMDARERGSTPEESSAAAARYMADVKHVVVSPA